MAIAIRPGRAFDYVLKADRTNSDGSANLRPTTWKLRALTMREAMEIEDGTAFADAQTNAIHARAGWATIQTLKVGLVGVENFLDEDGEDVAFESAPDSKRHPSRMVVTDAFLDRIAVRDRVELANAIANANRIGDDERGN